MSPGTRARLGDRLLARGLLRDEELALALDEQRRVHRPLGEILVELGFVDEEAVGRLCAEDLGLEFVPAGALVPDAELCAGLDAEFVRGARGLPLGRRGGRLRFALADPDDPLRLARVRERFGGELELVVATRTAIEAAARGLTGGAARAVARLLAPVAQAETALQAVPVDRLVQALFEDALSAGATDLHIEPDGAVTRVRHRIDGLLRSAENLPRALALPVITRLKILAGLDIAERRRPQDGRIHLELDERQVDLRLSLLPCAEGENAVLRILDRRARALSLAELGIRAAQAAALERVAARPHGLFLVTGPTGSGKTTTLYGLLTRVDALARNVVTIEDPIEYRLPLVRQTQVDPAVGFDFESGLRSVLRQDPDVILVGEIRDRATAEMALRAALTGHLVLSTLHTNSALGAVPRLCDLGVDPALVEDALIGVLAQRLVRRVCGACASERAALPEQQRWLGVDVPTVREGLGCVRCDGQGLRGRTALSELFLPDERCAAAIRGRAPAQELAALAAAAGFVPLFEDGRRRVLEGQTTCAEVLRVCLGQRLTEDERAAL